jgi:hypothetical protein
MRASLRPNREEHLWLMEYTPEGVGRHSYARIHRDEKKPPTLGEWEETPADSFSGRFVEPIVRAMKSV